MLTQSLRQVAQDVKLLTTHRGRQPPALSFFAERGLDLKTRLESRAMLRL